MSAFVERLKSKLIGTKIGDFAQARSHARGYAKIARDSKLKDVAHEVYDIEACVKKIMLDLNRGGGGRHQLC